MTKRQQKTLVLLCTLSLAMLALKTSAAETRQPDKAQLQQWAKDLGNDDYEKRRDAEQRLEKAGSLAREALTEATKSTDQEVKSVAERLLARERLLSQTVDYLDVLPAGSVAVARVRNASETFEDAKATALGKLIASPAMAPFVKELLKAINDKGRNGKELLEWAGHFKGQAAGAAWNLNPGAGQPLSGAIVEITDANPDEIFEKLATRPGATAGKYRGWKISQGPNGALALAGKHLVIGGNEAAVQTLIDGLLKPGAGFNGCPEWVKAKAVLGAKPDVLLAVDVKALVGAITALPIPGVNEILAATGVDGMSFLACGSAVAGNAFEDRCVVIYKDGIKGLAAATVVPAGAPEPVKAAALMPPQALAAIAAYLDGAKLEESLATGLDGVKKFPALRNQPGEGPLDKVDALEKLLQAQRIQPRQLLGNIKGDIGVWVVLGEPPAAAIPEIGLMVTFGDAAKALEAAAALGKAVDLLAAKPVVKQLPYKQRTVYQLDMAALTSKPNAAAVSPSWSVDGSRVFVSLTTLGLQKELNNLDSQTPGLLMQPEFMRALGELRPEERKGQIFYVDAKTLLTVAATIGLPALQVKLADQPGVKKALNDLPPPAELFKDFPPFISAKYAQGEQLVSVIRGPISPVFVLIGMAVVRQLRLGSR